jgi:hypothetical protein
VIDPVANPVTFTPADTLALVDTRIDPPVADNDTDPIPAAVLGADNPDPPNTEIPPACAVNIKFPADAVTGD